MFANDCVFVPRTIQRYIQLMQKFVLFIYVNKFNQNINCDMICKYLNKLKPCFGVHQIKTLMFPRITNSFSVAGHQTFGHYLTDADPVLMQLQKLNKYFARNNHSAESPFQRFITSIVRKQTLEAIGNKINIEDPSKREFNIFQVLAYCLFIEMKQQFKDAKVFTVIENQIYQIKRDKYFTYFQQILDVMYDMTQSLRNEEQMRLKQFQSFVPLFRDHILDCQMKFAKKQIYRRLYQMCKYAAHQQISNKNYNSLNILVEVFITKIDWQYHKYSLYLLNGLYYKLQNKQHHIYREIYNKDYYEQFCHPFVISEITELFSDQIEKGYYSPLLKLQDRYSASVGFEENLKEKKRLQNKSLSGQIQTITFIPTLITKILNSAIQNKLKNFFFSGMKEMGKSLNLLLLTILRGYTNQPKFLLIPFYTLEKMKKSMHMCIVQSYWKQLSKQDFIEVQQICQEINKKKKNNQSLIQQFNFYHWKFIQLICIIQNKSKGILFDQFSTFVGEHRELNQNNQQTFILNLFKKIYLMSRINVICCSSIAYQLQSISRLLGIVKQQINLQKIEKGFNGSKANHLFVIWLKRCYQNLLFFYKFQNEDLDQQINRLISLSKDTALIKISKENQQLKKLKQKNQADLQKIKNIEAKIDAIATIINANQKQQFISGQMSIIKKCAQCIIEKLLENPQIQISKQLINTIVKDYKILVYVKLIKNWLQIAKNSKLYLTQRKQIIMILLNGESLEKIQFLYNQGAFPQLPTFLLQKSQKSIKCELIQFRKQLWKQVKQMCQINSYDWKNIFDNFKKYRNKITGKSAIGTIVQMYMNDIFEDQKDINNSCLLKKIFEMIYPEKLQKIFKKVTFDKTISQKNSFIQISKEIDLISKKYAQQNSIFYISLQANFEACDQYLITLQKTENENKQKIVQASAIHIEIGINKSKANLVQIGKKVHENSIINNKYLQEGYRYQMQAALKNQNIILKSYDILLITGHNALKLSQEWQIQNNIKVLNFKDLYSFSEVIKSVQFLFQHYEKIEKLKKNQRRRK